MTASEASSYFLRVRRFLDDEPTSEGPILLRSPSMSRAYRFVLNGSRLPEGASQLEIDDVGLAFGGVLALRGVSDRIRQGEIHAIIGPNGAGKTSLLNCISGLYRPQHGS